MPTRTILQTATTKKRRAACNSETAVKKEEEKNGTIALHIYSTRGICIGILLVYGENGGDWIACEDCTDEISNIMYVDMHSTQCNAAPVRYIAQCSDGTSAIE